MGKKSRTMNRVNQVQSKTWSKTTVVAHATNGKTVNPDPTPESLRGTAVAPAKVHTHLPAPEAAKVHGTASKEAVKVITAIDKAKMFAKYLSGEVLKVKEGDAKSLSANQLSDICRARGWKHSGLKKDDLVRQVVGDGLVFENKGRGTGPKAEELRAECKAERAVAAAKGSDAYKGYSSQNKLGLGFMLANKGTKPQLKDNTYSVGTVSWMQQICREFGIEKFSGLKKAELIEKLMTSTKSAAKELVENAIAEGKIELSLPLMQKLNLTY